MLPPLPELDALGHHPVATPKARQGDLTVGEVLDNLRETMGGFKVTGTPHSAAEQIEEIADGHPVVFGELGQDGCGTDFVEPMLDWIGSRGYSVLGWAWNVADCSSFPALITDYDGTPTTFGAAFRQFFAAPADSTPAATARS